MSKKRHIKDFPGAKLIKSYDDGQTWEYENIKIFTTLEGDVKFTSVDEMVMTETLLKDFDNLIKERKGLFSDNDDDEELEIDLTNIN